MSWIIGFLVGVTVASLAFILWGPKNKRKINEARRFLLDNGGTQIGDAGERVINRVRDILDGKEKS